jgi:hypothetical protein
MTGSACLAGVNKPQKTTYLLQIRENKLIAPSALKAKAKITHGCPIGEYETGFPWNGRLDQSFPNTHLRLEARAVRASSASKIVTGPKPADSGREWLAFPGITQMQGHKGREFLKAKQKGLNKQPKRKSPLKSQSCAQILASTMSYDFKEFKISGRCKPNHPP